MESYTLSFPYGEARLNKEQYDIVTAHPGQTQRILAAAGSGKTTTITTRIAWLLTETQITANQIVLLTFSRNAAREMMQRVRRLIGPVNIWAGTFHALAKQILTLYGENSNGMLFIDELPVKWMQWLRTEKGRKWVGRLRYIIVDEFQDINAIQWRLLETLRHVGARMILVGDDAQNIYTWRGSSTGFLLDFHTVVPTVSDYQLKQNYRSTEAIVSVANRVMRGIPTLPWKEHMVANTKGGVKPDVLFFWRMSDECQWVAKQIVALRSADPTSTIGVLARNNIDLYRAEEFLVQQGIRTRILALEQTETLVQSTKEIVDLATFHGSKGLEWDITFLLCLSDDILPAQKTSHMIVAERRLFYVAITRARRRMFLTYHGNERTLTRFVREIGYQFLTYHGLAKYALSEFEITDGTPSLQHLLDSLDGDEWARIRTMNLLPWKEDTLQIPIVSTKLLPPGISWHVPEWSDVRDFEAFTRLWMKRALLEMHGWYEQYKDPLRERMIFTIRVFQEDIPFWETWRDEIDAAVKHFFHDTTRMEPANYADVEAWSQGRNLPWTQKEVISATSLLAKIRGQLRPLRFEAINLEEYTIRPSHSVIPSEYRTDVLRSWRRFVSPTIGWRDCLQDIWRLACLEQVSEGRTACLFRVGTVKDNLEECVPFLESLEDMLKGLVQEQTEILEPCFNPEVCLEGLRPTSCDLLLGNSLIRICGERRPDMYMWVETILIAYLATSSSLLKPIEKIQIVHPFYGLMWTYEYPDFRKAKELFENLLEIWKEKQ